ncbi:Uncharacterized membrane protein YccC [Actinacidiphila guanduensis]|uniref:Uncharacterized membrane protein YccC n=1 Tax=Actinacidiphila guanduensis TaxID=310781 RepID=A0A1H0LHY0_9ACTN|nr:Uncharacterized membrane protein YccC [Actinacidiphila guanduensis]
MEVVRKALRTLRTRDAGLAALRRAGRAAIVAPGLFALGTEVIGNPMTALFSSFGSIALLLFVDFGGPRKDRLAAQSALVAAGLVLVTLGTLASRSAWSAGPATLAVAFLILFSGVVSSVLATASTAMLATFVLSVSLKGPVSGIPDRLAGYAMAGAASVVAVTLLWPAPARDPLRAAVIRACALLARRLRAEADRVDRGHVPAGRAAPSEEAAEAATALRRTFFATPYRPTGLSTEARAMVRLVDEVAWLEAILDRTPVDGPASPSHAAVRGAKASAADLLERATRRLEASDTDPEGFRRDLAELRQARTAMEQAAMAVAAPSGAGPGPSPDVAGFVSSLEPGFRAQEAAAAVTAIAGNIALGVAARNRPWWRRALGRGSSGLAGQLSSAQERAGAHVEAHSVWLHNSLRGAVALGLAVLVAALTGVQHSFWVAFGTLAVLRSSALLTGQNALRALLGTVVGILIGGGILSAVGSDTTALWLLLPLALFFAGLAPAAISFAAGQAGFTAVLLILFDIIAPSGWSIGLVRFEDMAIGCAVSVGVGALFWPRGAGAALGRAMSDAVGDSARYLRRSVEYGIARCDPGVPGGSLPEAERRAAAAAARRLDDAFRGFLAERGTKHLPLADVTVLLTAVAVLRLTADAVLDLWRHEDGTAGGDRTRVRLEVLRMAADVCDWFRQASRALAGQGPVPPRPAGGAGADGRLLEAVRRDLAGSGGEGTATAVRVIWTADHLDVARRLQEQMVGPAREVAAQLTSRGTLADRVLRRGVPAKAGA